MTTLASVLVALTAATVAPAASADTAAAAAAARGCHGQGATNLFLRHGISTVVVQRLTCRRAVRTLRRWSRNGMPGRGPRGWSCRARRLNPDAKRHRCARGVKRMRFDVGGG